MPIRECTCGSGKERYDLTDAAGIFCTFVCESCESERRKRYDPAIFRTVSRYALTGEESDIGIDDRSDKTHHVFDTSGDAYDACQCDEGIVNGDLLDITSEPIVGLAWTWPVAVTETAGVLHSIEPGFLDEIREKAKWSDDQIIAAIAHARARELPIAKAFASYEAD